MFGDGSGGAFTVALGTTVDLTTTSGFNSLAGRHHLQFTNVTIAGSLFVPSGLTIRATGDVTITGTLSVDFGAEDSGAGAAEAGISAAGAGEPHGGSGLGPLRAAHLLRAPKGGGAGAKLPGQAGGSGAGSLVILAQGAFRLTAGGAINANGEAGASVSNLPGSGGGAGGLIVIAANTLTVGGVLRAQGGSGGDGNNTGGAGKGGGGGGGGGIVHLLASATPSITGSILVTAGAAGVTAPPTGGSQVITAGGGGGACGGDGGSGGTGTPAPLVAPEAGSAGYLIQTVTPSFENLFL